MMVKSKQKLVINQKEKKQWNDLKYNLNPESVIFFPCFVVVKNYLGVITGENLCPFDILIQLYIRIHVYHLSISLISE